MSTKLYAFLRTRGVGRRTGRRASRTAISDSACSVTRSARRAGVDYATLVHEVITGPLGMNDTVVELSPEQRRRFLQGYNDDRQPVPAMGRRRPGWRWRAALHRARHARRGWKPISIRRRLVRARSRRRSSRRIRSGHTSDRTVGLALAWMVHTDSGDLRAWRSDGRLHGRCVLQSAETMSRSSCCRTSGRVRRCPRMSWASTCVRV